MAQSLPLEDLVTCAVCQEIYDNPLALRCLHTLCRACVETMRKRAKITPNCVQCPYCRELSDARSLKHDFRVQTLVEIYKSQLKLSQQIHMELSETSCCQLCHKKAFIGKCLDCDKFLCDSCQATHNSIPTCEDHHVISVQEMLYKCKGQIDRIHDVLRLDKASLISKCNSLTDYINDLEKGKQDILFDLELSEEKVIAAIKNHYVGLREQLENRVNEQMVKVNRVKDNIIDVITKLMERSQKLVDSLSGADIDLVLSKMDSLKRDTDVLDKNRNQTMPKLRLELIHGMDMEEFDFSQLVKIDHKRDNELSLMPLSDSLIIAVNHDVINNTAALMDKSEESAMSYKFDYCDQVCIMLEKLQQNLNTCLASSDGMERLGNTHCMISPSKICQAAKRSNSNCDDVIALATESAISVHSEEILAKCHEPQSLRVIGNEIWCIYRDWVNIYDYDLHFKNRLERDVFGDVKLSSFTLKTIVQSITGHYFVACESAGLRILSPSRFFLRVLHNGNICDVIEESESVYALDTKAGEILVYKHHTIEHLRFRESPWKFENTIKSTCALTNDDTMAIVNDYIVVCSYRNDAIYRYNLFGEPLMTMQCSPSKREPGHLWRPRICCKTRDDELIFADHYHNRLQVLAPDGRWKVLKFTQKLNFPWDGVLANGCGLVVLERCNWKHKLLQFVVGTEKDE